MIYAQQPYYYTNVYEVQFPLEVFYAILRSNQLRSSLGLCVKSLREAEALAGKIYVGIAENNLIIIGDEKAVDEACDTLNNSEVLKAPVSKGRCVNSFSKSAIELKMLVARVLARCSLDLLFLQAFKEGKWTILDSIGKHIIFNESTMVQDLEEPFKSLVKIYKGLAVSAIYFYESDAFGNRVVKIGISADYSLAIIPAISIGELTKRGIQYDFDKFLQPQEVTRKLWYSTSYKIRRFLVWDLMKRDDEGFYGCRYEEDKAGEWKLIERKFDPSEIYPLRRPEIIDQMVSKSYGKTLTKIVKRLSFQITDENKKDPLAAYKRFEATKEVLSNLLFSIKGKMSLGSMNMIVSEEPRMIRIWGSSL
jgi:hypothetical protein